MNIASTGDARVTEPQTSRDAIVFGCANLILNAVEEAVEYGAARKGLAMAGSEGSAGATVNRPVGGIGDEVRLEGANTTPFGNE